MKRFIAALSFLLWMGIIISVYYVVQKPGLLQSFSGLVDTIWTLIAAALLLFNAYGIGIRILRLLGTGTLSATERLLLGTGLGLGVLGLTGLAFSAAQIAERPVFSSFLIISTAFLIFRNNLGKLYLDLKEFSAEWNLSSSQFNLLSKIAILLPFLFSFLLTLAPQFEAFDALLYHLTQPAQILQDGGLRAVDIPHFWFPNLTENVFLWALAMGSERAAQMLHLTWGLLAALLLWHWAVKIWNIEIGRKTLLLLAAIPSLPMLASWAYADMALVFYAIATLYTLTTFEATESPAWLYLGGIMAGLAMTVKYTSFTVPLTAGLLIFFWQRRYFSQAILRAAQFSVIAWVTALPWYARNAIVMGNPFYPFAFGGRYWDSFRAEWYADAGTGIGWTPMQLLLLPLNATLGVRDQNFFDGRIGPLFLILAPLAFWMLLTGSRGDLERDRSLQAIGLFFALSFAAWIYGVINSISLWQARLLFPALIPFAIPAALGWESLNRFDLPKLRISFLTTVLIGIVIAFTVSDNAIFVLRRNPLAVTFGAQSREQYIARVNPSYAALIRLMNELPEDSYIYNLFEPRSYALPRRTQPDAINDNFSHDFYLYETPPQIIERWRQQGYTHIVVYERGLSYLTRTPSSKITSDTQKALRDVFSNLVRIGQTPDQDYSIYRIP